MIGTTTLLIGALLAPQVSVALCDGLQLEDTVPVHQRYLRPDGSDLKLLLTDQPPDGCHAIELPVAKEQIRWAAVVPAEVAKELAKGVILQGMDNGKQLMISEVIPVANSESASAPPLPLMTDCRDCFTATTFGAEHRARHDSVGQNDITIGCGAGKQPAGVLLSTPRHLPGMDLELVLAYEGDATFEVGISDRRRLARESPLMLGALPAAATRQQITLPIPAARLQAGEPVAISLICPPGAAALQIHALEFRPTNTSETPKRATWVWQAQRWMDRPDQLVDELVAMGADRVYISVRLQPDAPRVAHPEDLAAFVRVATTRHIDVWAVQGDPYAVLPEGRAAFLRYTGAFNYYNSAHQIGARLAGIQYDIEPYLVPGYTLDTNAWSQAYVDTITALHKAIDLPMEVAVPFWWATISVNDQPLLDALTPSLEGITVMNYRTDQQQLQDLAMPFLEWGQRAGKQVRIALEAGPIQDETRWHFRPASHGRLWQVNVAGRDLLIVLDAPQQNPAGSSFDLTHMSIFSGDTTSFHDRRADLDALLPVLERTWTPWPGFSGIAVHEMLTN